MIKLIGFKIYGHSLFEDGTTFSIQTQNKVTKKTENRVVKFNDSLSLNKTIGLVGINATGKSTLMRIFSGLNNLYLFEESIEQTDLNKAFRSQDGSIKVEAYFASENNRAFKAETVFKEQSGEKNKREWVIDSEKIYNKQTKSSSKSKYFEFKNKNYFDRKDLSTQAKNMVKPNDSVFIGSLKNENIITNNERRSIVLSTVEFTDVNVPRTFADQTPKELLEYLDPSIEYLKYKRDDDGKIINCKLKFKYSENVIEKSSFNEITQYLSSGTIKGITLFFEFIMALRMGATLLVDEIELHINKQIARDFIGLFTDPDINIKKSTLIYSTHYIELTDDLVRNDEEYILKRDKLSKLVRLSSKIDRNDFTKSDIFQNNILGGTAPSYNRLQKLKKSIKHNMG